MSETITFFGSGPVAAEALKRLATDFEIEAVVTKPQPAHHKYSFPVIVTAKSLGLKTYTPANKYELDKLFSKEPVTSRLGIVLDYGIIISKSVIEYFPLGIINSHFSLLPHLRGADPISFAILRGDIKTGVSLMLITPALDEGPVLAQAEIKLNDSIATPQLTEELIKLSDKLLKTNLPNYVKGDIKPHAQSKSGLSYSRKLKKEDSILDWNKPAKELERQVRAFLEWPRSRTEINGIKIIVTQAHIISGSDKSPGELWLNQKELGFYTSDGIFVIDKLIPENKKEMTSTAFLAGYKL